jgi:replicative DNA helicase
MTAREMMGKPLSPASLPRAGERNQRRAISLPNLKYPPHSMEAEQSVLGGLMASNRRIDEVAELLREEDFYSQEHRLIYGGILELYRAQKPVDFVVLSEHLRQRGVLADCGGVAYLGTLAADTPSAANVRAYAEIVRERSVLRCLIAAGQDIAELGYQPAGRTVEVLLDEADGRLSQIRSRNARADCSASNYAELMELLERDLDSVKRSGGDLHGLFTGFAELDRMTNGMSPGDLWVIAGRPGMGKTAFAMGIVEYVGVKGKLPVAVFSMEMSRKQIMQRQLASFAGIPLGDLRRGRLDDATLQRVVAAGGTLRECPVVVDDSGALTPLELRARARRMKARGGLGLIVVDYLQLMRVPGSRESRTNEISEISRGLKALGKELGVPVIALSQLSRAVEARQNRRPLMSDLRESGGIEQDADVIAFIYRDEYYDPRSQAAGIAEVIVAKQRNGPTGVVQVSFNSAYTRFGNLPPGARYGNAEVADPPRQQRFCGKGKAPMHYQQQEEVS